MASIYNPHAGEVETEEALPSFGASREGALRHHVGGNVSFLTEFPQRRSRTDLHCLLGPKLGGLHSKPGQVCPATQRQKGCQLCCVCLRSLWLRPAALVPVF